MITLRGKVQQHVKYQNQYTVVALLILNLVVKHAEESNNCTVKKTVTKHNV